MVPPPAPFFAAAAVAGAAKVALEERALNAGAAGVLGAVLGSKQVGHGLFRAQHTYQPKKKPQLFLPAPKTAVSVGTRRGRSFTLTKTRTSQRRQEETVCCYDMPYRSSYKPRRFGRRRCYKRKVYKRKRSTIPYAVPAKSQVVKFEMLTPATVSTNSTTASVLGTPILFAYNDVYSPDAQNTTFQPAGLDQWNHFYTYATVLWSKIEIVASSTVDDEILVGVTRGPYSRIQTG